MSGFEWPYINRVKLLRIYIRNGIVGEWPLFVLTVGVARLTVFSYKKMYGRFSETKKTSHFNLVTVRPGSIVERF